MLAFGSEDLRLLVRDAADADNTYLRHYAPRTYEVIVETCRSKIALNDILWECARKSKCTCNVWHIAS